ECPCSAPGVGRIGRRFEFEQTEPASAPSRLHRAKCSQAQKCQLALEYFESLSPAQAQRRNESHKLTGYSSESSSRAKSAGLVRSRPTSKCRSRKECSRA